MRHSIYLIDTSDQSKLNQHSTRFFVLKSPMLDRAQLYRARKNKSEIMMSNWSLCTRNRFWLLRVLFTEGKGIKRDLSLAVWDWLWFSYSYSRSQSTDLFEYFRIRLKLWLNDSKSFQSQVTKHSIPETVEMIQINALQFPCKWDLWYQNIVMWIIRNFFSKRK